VMNNAVSIMILLRRAYGIPFLFYYTNIITNYNILLSDLKKEM
jgi:hypothetical protein